MQELHAYRGYGVCQTASMFRWEKAGRILNKFDVSGIYMQLYGYFYMFS